MCFSMLVLKENETALTTGCLQRMQIQENWPCTGNKNFWESESETWPCNQSKYVRENETENCAAIRIFEKVKLDYTNSWKKCRPPVVTVVTIYMYELWVGTTLYYRLIDICLQPERCGVGNTLYYCLIEICLQPGRCGSLHGRCYDSPKTHVEPVDDEQTQNELFEFEDLTFLMLTIALAL